MSGETVLAPVVAPVSVGIIGEVSDTSVAGSEQTREEIIAQEEDQGDTDESLDIFINNVVSSFNVRCHLNLKKIAMEGCHVEYKRETGMLNMKIRNPSTTASIWSSGKITVTGARSEIDAKVAARKFARILQKFGFNVRFSNFRIVNVLGTCSLPFTVRIVEFSGKYRENASYEPELHPGVTYKLKSPKATLKIFSTGSITVTAPSVNNVKAAIDHVLPLVAEFKAGEGNISRKVLLKQARLLKEKKIRPRTIVCYPDDFDSDDEFDSEDELSDEFSYDDDDSDDF